MTHAYCVIKPGQLLDPPSIRRSAMAACVAKGITYCHIGVPWSTFQSAVGGSTAAGVDSLRLYLDDVQASGMKAIVEVALHYAPAFVTSGVEQFKDQSANLWSDTGASGQNVRNWQWTTLGRTYVADLFNHLRISGIASHPAVAGARMGGGYRGEAHYAPVSGGTTPWWIFGASLQSGAGLSSDMTVCPFPGRTPAWDGTHDDQDDAIANWWLNGMNTWISWLIAQHKAAGFGGIGQELWVLHPSTGVRDRPHTDNGWKLEVAQGADPRRLMASYAHDNKVWPWSTWNNNTGSSTSETGMGSCVTLEKWDDSEAHDRGEAPDSVEEYEGNLLMTAGATRLLSLLTGTGGQAYDATHSRIGVGDSVTAESAAQTDLQGTNKYFKLVDATFPSVLGHGHLEVDLRFGPGQLRLAGVGHRRRHG
jgi:hypothetical protein